MRGIIDHFAFSLLLEGDHLFIKRDDLEAQVRLEESPGRVSVRVKLEEIYSTENAQLKVGDTILAKYGELYHLHCEEHLAAILKQRWPNGITENDLVAGRSYFDLTTYKFCRYDGLTTLLRKWHRFVDKDGKDVLLLAESIKGRMFPTK